MERKLEGHKANTGAMSSAAGLKGPNADGSKEVNCHENLVGAAFVGCPPNLVLGLERIAPGESEVAAARRLLRSLYQRHNRYADILTFDSLYAQASLINEVLEQNKLPLFV